MSFAVFLRL